MSAVIVERVCKTFVPDWMVLRLIRRALFDPRGRSETLTALKDVDLTIEKGVILGLLGPNGAGKSTLLRIVAGALLPTEGTVRVDGLDPVAERSALSGRIGWLIRDPRSFDDSLSGHENLCFFGGLQGMGLRERTQKAREMIAAVGLEAVGNTPMRKYNTDMRQRLSVGRALLSSPDLLIMDEATAGLDADQRSNFYGFLLDHVRMRGCTVLYATHDLNEAQFLCHEVALMDAGQLVAQGSFLDVQSTAIEIFSRERTAPDGPTSLYPGQIEQSTLDRNTQSSQW